MAAIGAFLLLIISTTASAMGSNCISISTNRQNSYAYTSYNQLLVVNGIPYKLVARHPSSDAYITEFYLDNQGRNTYGILRYHNQSWNDHHDHSMIFDQYNVGSNNLISSENFICDSELFHTPDSKGL